MESLRTLYKVGLGPSSSHTFGPKAAAELFKSRNPDADHYTVILYGSLALTGTGHGTGKSIRSVLDNVSIIPDDQNTPVPHPNTMDFIALKNGSELGTMRIMSIGGGAIEVDGEVLPKERDVYHEKNFDEILYRCKHEGMTIPEYVRACEGDGIYDHLKMIWETMEDCIKRGLETTGMLPGPLGITRKAKILSQRPVEGETPDVTQDRIISSYAFAVAEENACEGTVVTAPTCGAAGVLPAVLYYMHENRGFSDDKILDALATAGVIGNVIRTNASISGAEAGCQAEIGSACSMAAAAVAQAYGFSLHQIEYAAEVAMEHSLGLTCDPVQGLVQIPCIERCAVAAMRAMNCVSIARFLADTRKISFDNVVDTMYRTGKDISPLYRETSEGGLARLYE